MSKDLLRIWECPLCGYESKNWEDFVSQTDTIEENLKSQKNYIKINRTTQCPNCLEFLL